MASSSITCNFHPSISFPISATRFSISFSHPLLCTYNGLSLHPSSSSFRVFAKFEKFQSQPSQSQEPDPSPSLEETTETSVQDDEEDDRYCTTLQFELCKLCCFFPQFMSCKSHTTVDRYCHIHHACSV